MYSSWTPWLPKLGATAPGQAHLGPGSAAARTAQDRVADRMPRLGQAASATVARSRHLAGEDRSMPPVRVPGGPYLVCASNGGGPACAARAFGG